jgi:DNA-binding transcriptional LysR family regulator
MDRLAAMEAFVLVVDTGSFSAAARRLNIGQPAVSKMVAQLEDRLGVKLLARTTRGLTATEAGLGFYERARRSIEEADEAELAVRAAGSSLTGRLRICAAVTFARIHIIPRLPEFLARHQQLEMEVVLDDRNIDLVQEGIDVALRMGGWSTRRSRPGASPAARMPFWQRHPILRGAVNLRSPAISPGTRPLSTINAAAARPGRFSAMARRLPLR